MSAKDTLRANKTAIELILSANRQLVLRKVYEKKMITDRDHLNLKNIYKESEEGHVVELVDNIMGKGEARCKAFLDFLQTDEEIRETFPQLQDTLLNAGSGLPRPAQETSSADKRGAAASKTKRPKEDEVYPLNSKPIGLCFIINNMNFQKPRYGSDVDAESLAETFSWLGFRVLMCEDQTKDEMDRVLKCLSASDISKLQEFRVQEWSNRRFTQLQEAPTHGDAFICCILSHGNAGVVCGINWEKLAIKEIKKTFKATDESPLKNKPKVFLIQACQGTGEHGRVVLPDVQSDDGTPPSIPEESDFLIAIATVEDYESYRLPSGSWFIQSVCKQLNKSCDGVEDIYTILSRVNEEVSRKEGQKKEKPGVILKQMPEFRSNLTKRLVLSPPRD